MTEKTDKDAGDGRPRRQVLLRLQMSLDTELTAYAELIGLSKNALIEDLVRQVLYGVGIVPLRTQAGAPAPLAATRRPEMGETMPDIDPEIVKACPHERKQVLSYGVFCAKCKTRLA